MSQNCCCVPGCEVTKKDGIPLHRFPDPHVNAGKFNTWIVKIGGEIAVMDNLVVFYNRRVCHKHFEAMDKYPSKRLSKLAIPTLYLPDQLHTESVTLPSLPSTSDIHKRDQLVTEPVTLPAFCSVSGVQETQTGFQMRDSQRVLHWFPNPKKDITRFRTWVHAIGGEIIGLSNEHIYKLRRVCHTHFEGKFCCRNNKISNIAVPTLLIPGATTPSTQKELYVCDDPEPTASKASLASLSAPGTSRATAPTIDITPTEYSSGFENTDTDIRDDDDDADDDSDTLVESNVCRVCLAMDVQMYDLNDIELREMFQNITGIAVTENNHPILERLCWECAGRVKAAAAFRNQALLSDALLQGLANTDKKIRRNDITLIKENKDYLKSVGSSSAVEVFHIVDIDPENDGMPPLSENNDTKIVQNTVRKDFLKKKHESIIKEENDQMDVKAPIATDMEYDQFDHICRNTGKGSSKQASITNNLPFRVDKIYSANSSALPSCSQVEPKYPVLDYLIKTPRDLKGKIKKPMTKITKRDSTSKIVSKNSIEVIGVLKGDAKLKNIYVKIGGISKKTSELKLVNKTQVKANTRIDEESRTLKKLKF